MFVVPLFTNYDSTPVSDKFKEMENFICISIFVLLVLIQLPDGLIVAVLDHHLLGNVCFQNLSELHLYQLSELSSTVSNKELHAIRETLLKINLLNLAGNSSSYLYFTFFFCGSFVALWDVTYCNSNGPAVHQDMTYFFLG